MVDRSDEVVPPFPPGRQRDLPECTCKTEREKRAKLSEKASPAAAAARFLVVLVLPALVCPNLVKQRLA